MLKRTHYIWCLLLLGVLGFSFYCLKAETIFPSASIDLSINRNQVAEIAASWAHKLDYNEPSAIKSTVFTFDDDAKTFLEYELGSDHANELMRTQIPVWYWVSRFCQPLKQEEFSCWVSPQGKLVAFENAIPNDRAMTTISHEQARRKAFAFVHDTGGVDLSHYRSVEDGSIQQPARVDHNFTWEDTVNSYHGARERVHAYISGSQVTSYNHFLYVPEQWSRKFSRIRSYNDALAAAASLFYYGIMFGAFFVFLWALASGMIRWRFSLAVSFLSAGIACLETLNSLPSSIHAYETSLPFSAFQLQFLLSMLSASMTAFFSTLVLIGSGEAIYRLMKPHDLALENLFTPGGLRSKRTLENIAVGVALFGLHLGWISLYYLAGRKLGFWSPLEVDNAEALSSVLPFFSAMEVGWSAGLTEELAYRVIGLAAFKKVVRNFWLANFLQAAAWAFMHSNYPQEPPYARGVELTVVGFIYGAVLQRFGFMACFFSHNLLDTFMGIAPLLSSHLKGLQASALIALFPFLLYVVAALWLMRKRGDAGEEPQQALLNQALTAAREPPVATVAKSLREGYLYSPLSGKTRILLSLLLSCAIAVCAFISFPVISGHLQVNVGRDDAIKIARQYLLDHGMSAEGLRVTAWLGKALSSDEMQYVFEIGRQSTADRLSMNPERPLWWSVRFFKPTVQEEFLVVLDQAGKLMSCALTEPEAAPGEKVSKEEAQRRVEQFLLSVHPEIVPFTFEDVTEQKREARTDYLFRYNVPKFKIGDAKYHAAVDCIGGKVSGYDTGWNLPDKWVFQRSITTTREQLFSCLFWIFGVVCLLAVLLWARGVLQSGAIIWRPAIVVGLGVTSFSLLHNINESPLMFYGYKTNVPLVSFYVAQAVGYVVGALSTFAMASLVAAFGFAAMRLLLIDTSVTAVVKTIFTPTGKAEAAAHRNLWVDGVLVGYAAAFGDLAVTLLSSYIRSRISPGHTIAPLDVLAHYANLFDSSMGALIESVLRGVYYVFIAAIAAGLYAKYITSFRKLMLLGLVIGAVIVGSYKYWQDASVDFVCLILSVAFSWLFFARFARENLLAYFFLGFASVLVAAARVLGRYGEPLFFHDCLAIVVFLLAPAAYALIRAAGGGNKGAESVDVEPLS